MKVLQHFYQWAEVYTLVLPWIVVPLAGALGYRRSKLVLEDIKEEEKQKESVSQS